MEAAGASVEEVSLPHTDYGLATYYIIAPANALPTGALRRRQVRPRPIELRRVHRRLPQDERRRFRAGGQAADHARHLRLSAGYYDAYYLKAQKVRTLIKADFDAVWAGRLRRNLRPDKP